MQRTLAGAGIVVSILLAFAIDAAWAQRLEIREEERLLAALHDEFVANSERVDGALRFHSALRAAGDSILSGTNRSSEDFDELLVDLSWWGGFWVLESATLDAVVLGGKLDLIRSDDLRRLLTGWIAAKNQVAAQENEGYEHYRQVWLPFLRRRSNLAQIGNAADAVPGSSAPYFYEAVPDVGPRQDHRSLVRDREFLNAVTEKMWIEDTVLNEYRQLREKLTEVLRLLEEELNR